MSPLEIRGYSKSNQVEPTNLEEDGSWTIVNVGGQNMIISLKIEPTGETGNIKVVDPEKESIEMNGVRTGEINTRPGQSINLKNKQGRIVYVVSHSLPLSNGVQEAFYPAKRNNAPDIMRSYRNKHE